MNKAIESQLKRIEPVSKLKMFVGDTKIYDTTREYNDQIKETDVYTLEQMIEFAKFVSGYTAEYVSYELDEACWEMEGHMLGISYSAQDAIKELFEDNDNGKESVDGNPKLTLEDFL
ncbi:hypothetical protein WRP3_144 [Lactococcus phage WRP3]|uniref:Uncharacterized protein n=1 Tax=Lactococcus phage WRP3 TaxID=1560313 RepID=A0A0D3MSZ4_9CAUD|nr:hypothetical protein ACQ37_gp144 [Lactococcus phage WRP3]AIX12647.1 hypothetical protein WRP3_144 [Lactococcus phage WRP3]